MLRYLGWTTTVDIPAQAFYNSFVVHVSRTKKTIVFITSVALAICIIPFAHHTAVAQQPENGVSVYFATQYDLQIYGDSFENKEVTGQAIWRISDIINRTDESGEPDRDLRVTLESDQTFEWVMHEQNLTKMGPPVYEWYFGDLEEEHKHTGWATDVLVGYINQASVQFTPGLDVSRSFNRTLFTNPDTQTIMVTVTSRDDRIDSVEVFVHTDENDLVDPVIISHSGSEEAQLTPDGRRSGIKLPVKTDETVSITVTIQVTPKVPEVEYKPHVGIKPNWRAEAYTGTSFGSSVSYSNDAGKWTVSAEGNYAWEWGANKVPGYGVTLRKMSNVSPTLSSASVSPFFGILKTNFNFEATYSDNSPPSYVRIYLDDISHEMNYVRGAEQGYDSGAVFNHSTTLSPGKHKYYFEASDGYLTTRLPEKGSFPIEVTSQTPWTTIGGAFAVVVIALATFLVFRRQKFKI